MSRTICSFWSSGFSIFEEVSQKTLVLEVRIFSFRGRLAENARFGSLDLQFAQNLLVLEVRIFSFRGSLAENAPFPASRTLPQSPLQGCYRSHRFKNVTAVTTSRMWPQSPFQEFDRFKNVTEVIVSRMWPLSPLQECDRGHCFKNVAAVAASRMWPRSLFQECGRCRRFKNVTAAAASWMLPQSPLQECFTNATAAAASRRLPQSPLQERYFYQGHRFKKVTAVTVSRMRTQSPLQECDRSHRFKNLTAVSASRMLPRSPLQELVSFASRIGAHSHTHCLVSFAGIFFWDTYNAARSKPETSLESFNIMRFLSRSLVRTDHIPNLCVAFIFHSYNSKADWMRFCERTRE